MAKSSSPSRAPRNAPQLKVHRYIDALVADDFGRLSKLTIGSANAFARKKLDTASQSLQLRNERREKKARRIEIREWRAAERSVAEELRESAHRIRLMSRQMKTKVRPEKKVRHTPPKARRRDWGYSSVALPRYDGPVIDRRGQRGVFMRVRYYSRRTAEQGVSQRVVKYCFHGAELDENGKPYVASNVGLDIDEALCGFDHLEQINWSAAKNAKLLMHGILAVDHRQSPDEMMTCGVRWAEETLGRFDLPYLVTLHAPPLDGDERNWHLHVLWSYRPMVRTGDHEWQVAEMLRTDLDNPAAMKVFREMFAAVMTDVSFDAGQNQVWTAKSNADRGLVVDPQVHLGEAKTNRARNGEYVAENEDNHERVMRSKAAVIDEALRHADEALAKAQAALRAVAAQFARLPTLPMRIPERVVAATMAIDAPALGKLPPLSAASIGIPAMPISANAEPARIADRIGTVGQRPVPQSSVDVSKGATPKWHPRPAPVEIANMRIPSLAVATARNAIPNDMPQKPPRATISTLPMLPLVDTPRIGRIGITVSIPPVRAKTAVPELPVVTSLVVPRSTYHAPVMPGPGRSIGASVMRLHASMRSPPRASDVRSIDRMIVRIDDAQRLDDERRQRDLDEAERAVREADAVTGQRMAIERLLLTIAEERHHLEGDGKRRAVYPDLLARFGLSVADVADHQVQARLVRIAEEQNGEIARLYIHISGKPGDLRRDEAGWSLKETAPQDIRQLVAAWSNDRTIGAAFARFVTQIGNAVKEPLGQAGPGEATGSAWRRARQDRERAMAAWDEHERLDGAGMARPGQNISRPSGSADTPVRTDVTRRFPGSVGSGLGD